MASGVVIYVRSQNVILCVIQLGQKNVLHLKNLMVLANVFAKMDGLVRPVRRSSVLIVMASVLMELVSAVRTFVDTSVIMVWDVHSWTA
jgi:hypothetical protein